MSVSTARQATPDAAHSGPARRLTPGWASAIALVVVMVIVGLVLEHWLVRVTEWRVMADELLYTEMARSMAHNLSPLPVVRGEHAAVYSVLYPLIISPAVGLFDTPTAFQAIRIINIAVMVSTAVPAYLLARQATSRGAALIAATLSILVPWMTASASVMTEVAAYPAFAWAAYAMTVAIATPSAGRDVLALAAIALACLARTQFALLVVAFPAAVLVHSVGRRIALDGPRDVRSVLLGGPLDAVRQHVVAAVAVAVGVALLLFDSHAVLGSYAATTSTSSILPPGLLGSALDHLAYITVAIAALPVVLAIAFVLATVGRPVDVRAHALASLALVVVAATTLVVSSFDLRFIVQGREVQERYLFYICPLLFACAVAWFRASRVSIAATAAGALATAGIVLAQHYRPLPAVNIEGFASPNRYFFSVLDGRLYQVESWFGLHSLRIGPALAGACIVLAAAAVVAVRRGLARPALVAFGVLTGLFLVTELAYALPRVADDHNGLARTALGIRPLASRDWIDEQVDGRSTGVVVGSVNLRDGRPLADPLVNLAEWWDLAFWNKSVDQLYRFGEYNADQLVTAPIGQITVDFTSGALRASDADPPPRLVLATGNVRFAPEYRGTPVEHGDVTLYRAPLPYRASWATEGVDDDGTTRLSRPAVVRVFARRGAPAGLTEVSIRVSHVPGEGRSHRYTVTVGGATRLRRFRDLRTERLTVCVPAAGHADVTLKPQGGTASGTRIVQIQTRPTNEPCHRS